MTPGGCHLSSIIYLYLIYFCASYFMQIENNDKPSNFVYRDSVNKEFRSNHIKTYAGEHFGITSVEHYVVL